MFAKFDFRVTSVSMMALFVATVLYVLGVSYLASSGGIARCYVWLVGWLGPTGAFWTIVVNRALETLLFVVMPFRSHLRERAVLIHITLSVSFCGSVAPWILWGLSQGALVVLAIAYGCAYAIYWMLIWNDDSKPVEVPKSA